MTFLKKIESFSKEKNLFFPGNKILIAISGGPDSVSLLCALNELRHNLGINLYAAHLNHGIRKDSNKDEKFVKSLCSKLNISCTIKRIKIKKKSQSLEEAAREQRIQFLINTAKKYKIDSVAIGHTSDDLAETVLMRIIRGAGLYGIRSILPKRHLNGTMFIRPMLTLTRNDVLKFLKKKQIKFCVDSTNKQKVFMRNRIRLELIPALEKKYNPNIKNTLKNLCLQSSIDYEFLEENARDAFIKLVKFSNRSNNFSIKIDNFSKYHTSIQRLVIRFVIERLSGSTRKLTFSHIEEIEDLILNRPNKSIVNLPNAIVVEKKSSMIIFYIHSKTKNSQLKKPRNS